MVQKWLEAELWENPAAEWSETDHKQHAGESIITNNQPAAVFITHTHSLHIQHEHQQLLCSEH